MRVSIKDLRSLFHPESVNKSFRLTVAFADYASLLRDVWPTDEALPILVQLGIRVGTIVWMFITR